MRFYDPLGHAPPNYYRIILLFVNREIRLLTSMHCSHVERKRLFQGQSSLTSGVMICQALVRLSGSCRWSRSKCSVSVEIATIR